MRLARLVCAGFGTGWAPAAPGTVGSLLGLAVGAALLSWHPASVWVAAAATTLAGFIAIRTARIEGDPGWVVIDEVAGQLLALTPLHRPSWFGCLAAFALFRALDIAKPGPVGWADRQPGPSGIMADDVMAGALAAAVIAIAQAVP